MKAQEDARLWCVGDPHGRYTEVLRLALERKPDAIIFLGDLQLPSPPSELFSDLREAGITARAVFGNHDSDGENYWERYVSDPELSLHGRVEDIGGLRVAGLGGVFRQKFAWYPPAEPVHRSFAELEKNLARLAPRRLAGNESAWFASVRRTNRSSIFPADYDALLRQHPADILVTHEAPGMHPHGFAAVSELGALLDARIGVHGHHHESITYPVGADGVRWYGVDMREIIEIQGLDSAPKTIAGQR